MRNQSCKGTIFGNNVYYFNNERFIIIKGKRCTIIDDDKSVLLKSGNDGEFIGNMDLKYGNYYYEIKVNNGNVSFIGWITDGNHSNEWVYNIYYSHKQNS